MDDAQILRRLRRQDAAALEAAITRYGAYAAAVVRGRSRGLLRPEDQEEIVSDVFVALWQSAPRISGTQLRPWLGAVARNRTVEAMRRENVYVPLEDDEPAELGELWERMYEKQRYAAVRRAMAALSKTDREIFCRFYDLSQTTEQIAQTMGMNASTVRSRLRRGRQTLRDELCKGGSIDENVMG